MKRRGNLYPEITSWSNLILAARKAQKSKRFRDNVLSFNHNLESELIQIQRELETKTYQPGAYRTFEIYQPKARMISAAPYRDRIVHHALCNVIVPIIEKSFIPDSYANRLGFGSHKALRRCIKFARSSDYVLQCDIQKYFPTIDHKILKQKLRHYLKCPDTLWLIDKLIDNSNHQWPVIEYFPDDNLITPVERRRGLPIGNLTSQFFANVYLNGFDHFIKENLKAKKYLRYVDDFALFSDDLDFLESTRLALESYLAELRLKIHPIKSQIFRPQHGVNFLGFRILPEQVRVSRRTLSLGRRRLKILQGKYAEGKVTQQHLSQSIQSWSGHLSHGDTWHLQQQLFTPLALARG
jgi:retron-type reverse transcriptase